MNFTLIPRGKAWLGGGDGKEGTKEVAIDQDFYLGTYEVTQEEWQKIMGKNPSVFSRDGKSAQAVKDVKDADLKRFPVENISWEQAKEFVKLVNEKARKNPAEAGWEYRLPTEEEWEYACRGGPMTGKAESAFDFYLATSTTTLSKDLASFKDAGLGRPGKVGSYLPNRLGLYDMHGNVMEWCDDKQDKNGARMARGGAFSDIPYHCGAGYGRTHPPSSPFGLRLARVPVDNKFINKLGMEFMKVPRGTAWLAAHHGNRAHIPYDFYLGTYEVTQEEWFKVMGTNPSSFSRRQGQGTGERRGRGRPQALPGGVGNVRPGAEVHRRPQ